jgi:hypothetical protein
VNDQLVTEDAINTTNNKNKRRTSVPSVGFEPAVPDIKLQQTYTFVHMATGISIMDVWLYLFSTLAKKWADW